MSFDPAVKKTGSYRVLVAPLDWGLGHATRCIPVIYELIRQGVEVWIGGEGAQVFLLKKEFPQLRFLPLNGYNIKYGGSAMGLLWSMIKQVPSILKTIRYENEWLKNMVEEHDFDAVISDNRYGLYHPHIPSVFITHQLRIKTPFGRKVTDILQKKNYRYINRFTECWIPDLENENGLAGELSHPVAMPAIPVRYLGLLSRLKKTDASIKKAHLFISLSGPEPQRSLLENKIIHDISRYNGTAVIVRSLPGEANLIPSTNDIRIYNHLPASDYNFEMEKAEWVISRSGYSTVMDLACLGKKSILVPTPGQTEQQYLGKYLEEKKFAVGVDQKNFSLTSALEKAVGFDFHPMAPVNTVPDVVDAFLKKIRVRHEPIHE